MIQLTDTVYGDVIRIFADEELALDSNKNTYVKREWFVITKYITEYDKDITFRGCIDLAKKNGFEHGIFYIMADSPLEGTLYKCLVRENEDPYIIEYGKTNGYA